MAGKQLPIGAAVLAAGIARRMGRSKLDLTWPLGGSVLGRVLDVLTEGGVDHAVVITGGHRERVERIAADRGIPVVYNPEYETGGMLSSISAALAALEDTPVAGALIMPADHPLVVPETIQAIIAAWRGRPDCIWAPSYERRRGHPILIPRAHWQTLVSEEGQQGLRSFLGRREAQIEHLDVPDPGIRLDIDDSDAYLRLRDSLDR
jgi:CTP:molybdopterin cytidylyltransferase MocA